MADDSYKKFQEQVKKSKYAPKDDAPSPAPKPSPSKPTTAPLKREASKTEVVKVRNTNPQSPNFGQMEDTTNYYDERGKLVASEKVAPSSYATETIASLVAKSKYRPKDQVYTEVAKPGDVSGSIAKGGSIGGFKGKMIQTTTPQSTASIGAGIGLSSGNAALGSAVGGGVLAPTEFGGVAKAPMGVREVGSAVGGGTLFTVKGAFGAQEPKRFIEIGTGTQGETIYQQEDAPKKYVPTIGARVGSSTNRKEVLTQQTGPFGGMQIKSENILKLNLKQEKEIIAKEGLARSVYSPYVQGSLGQIILAPQGGRQQAASFIITGPLIEGVGAAVGAAGEAVSFVIKGEGPVAQMAADLKILAQGSRVAPRPVFSPPVFRYIEEGAAKAFSILPKVSPIARPQYVANLVGDLEAVGKNILNAAPRVTQIARPQFIPEVLGELPKPTMGIRPITNTFAQDLAQVGKAIPKPTIGVRPATSTFAQDLTKVGKALPRPSQAARPIYGTSLSQDLSTVKNLAKTELNANLNLLQQRVAATTAKDVLFESVDVGFAGYVGGAKAVETYIATGDVDKSFAAGILGGATTYGQFKMFELGAAQGAAGAAGFIDSLLPTITRVGTEVQVKQTVLARKSGSSTAVTIEKFSETPLKAGQEFKLTTVKGTGQSFTQRVFGVEQEKVLQKQTYTEQFGTARYSGFMSEDALKAEVLANGKTETTYRQFASGEGPAAMIPEIKTERFATLRGKLSATDGIGTFQAVAKVGKETLRTDKAAKQELSVQTRPLRDSDFAVFGLESDITVGAGRTETRTLLETTVPEQLFEYGPATPVTRTVTDEIFFEAPTVKIRTRVVPRPGQYTTAAESELTFVERPSITKTRVEKFENELTTESSTSLFESKPNKLSEGKAQRIVNIPEPKPQIKVTYGGKVDAELVQEFKFSQGTNRLRLTSQADELKALEFEGTRGLSARARESTYREFKPRTQVPSEFFDEGYGLKLETKKETQRYQSTFNATSAQFYKATAGESEVMVKSYSMPGKPAIQSKFIPRVAQVMGLRFDRQTLSKNITQQIQDQKLKAKQLGDIKNILKPSTESRIGSLYETKISSMLKSDLAQGLKQGQELKSMLKENLKKDTQLKSQSTMRFDFTRPGRDLLFRGGRGELPPPPEVPLLPMFGDFKLDFTKQSNGFNTYVREKGKLVKVNKQPQYREQAERQGRYYVEHSTAAAYKVVPTNKPASLNQENVPDVPSSEFRPSKRGGFTVEKNKFRINTAEERAGITAKGLRSIRNRNTFKFGNIKVKL